MKRRPQPWQQHANPQLHLIIPRPWKWTLTHKRTANGCPILARAHTPIIQPRPPSRPILTLPKNKSRPLSLPPVAPVPGPPDPIIIKLIPQPRPLDLPRTVFNMLTLIREPLCRIPGTGCYPPEMGPRPPQIQLMLLWPLERSRNRPRDNLAEIEEYK